ncbi:MAG: S41 family peptidase [Lachnospiraceae bacterium]|nr:S41 family peptidase [Lachnospiraceae bacterium]
MEKEEILEAVGIDVRKINQVNAAENRENDNESKKKGGSTVKGFFLGVVVTAAAAGILYQFVGRDEKEEKIKKYIDEAYLDEVDEETLQEGAYAGMAEALGDPYSTYFTIEEYESLSQENEGTYVGIGIVMQQDPDLGTITVVRCYEGAPGEQAGIKVGDIIYKVNDEVVTADDLSDAAQTIKNSGEEGVHLTLIREGETDYIEIDVAPEEVELPVVAHEMLGDKIGYLAIYEFKESTLHQYQEAFADLESQGMERIIIDLRNNPGGLMTSVTGILNTILPEGTIVYTLDKYGNRRDYTSTGETPIQIPMVVLTNEYSASASEIFAGAVRDYDIAKLVGTTTYGKGVVQNIFPLGDGTALKLTIANYYTPNGININGEGLVPDVEVELDLTPQEDGTIVDNQLETAIETVKAM